MAQSIAEHGGSLWEILQAGQWKSSAFMAYLRKGALISKASEDLALQVAVEDAFEDDSDGDAEDPM